MLRSSPTRSLQARGVHAAQFLLQVVNLVADPCRELELEVARGGHHLLGQISDEIGQFGARHVGGVAALDDACADGASWLTLSATATR